MPGKTLINYVSSRPRLVLTVDLALNVDNGLREAITDNVPRERGERRGAQRKTMEENRVKMYRQIYTTQHNLPSTYSTVYSTV